MVVLTFFLTRRFLFWVIYDPCHFVRGVKPGSESPREIVKAIPGIKMIEMENRREVHAQEILYALPLKDMEMIVRR